MVLTLAVWVVVHVSPVAVAQEQKLTASDGQAEDEFGNSVATSGDFVIVGARQDDDNGENAGAAYIFERMDGVWIEQQKLLASDGEVHDEFGQSVGVWGDIAIVGASKDYDNGPAAGSAYIFERVGGTWIEQQKLLGDVGTSTQFGQSVTMLDENTVIVGSVGSAVYIFERVGGVWIRQQKLTPSDSPNGGTIFGNSVGVSGNFLIVGAYGDNDNGLSAGAAYIFERGGGVWVEQQKLLASDGEIIDHFGRDVAISGDFALVGANQDDDNGENAGAVYIFERVGGVWVEQQKLLASDGQGFNRLGWSVSISGDLALVGAWGDNDNGFSSGSAYIFERDGGTWIEQQKLTPSDGDAGDHFGWSLILLGDFALVGAFWDEDNGNQSGSAYTYSLGAIRYVAPTGNDTGNDCLDPLTPCATLAHAVVQANNGDTIELAAGTYTEPGLLIEKAVFIRGQGVVVQ